MAVSRKPKEETTQQVSDKALEEYLHKGGSTAKTQTCSGQRRSFLAHHSRCNLRRTRYASRFPQAQNLPAQMGA